MSRGPADFVGLAQKGRIAVGADADLVAFAPDATFTVHADELQHKNPVSAYDGRELRGVVRRTWLRGSAVSTTPDAAATGHLLSLATPLVPREPAGRDRP
jgi:allantoinase